MLQTTGFPRLQTWVRRLIQYRNFEYVLFIALILYKLAFFHSHLGVSNIDMNPLDYVIAIGSIMLASFWVLWLPPLGRKIALIIMNVLLTALIYSDLVYYRYFQDFITMPVLLQAGQVSDLGDSIESLLRWSDILFIIDWIVYIPSRIVMTVRRRRAHGNLISTRVNNRVSMRERLFIFTRRLVSGILIFVLGYALTLGPIKFYTSTWAVGLFVGNWWNLALYNVTGLLGFHYYEASNYIKEHYGDKPVLTQQQEDEVKQWFDLHQANRQPDPNTFGEYEGSNVIVIQSEAFMNFVIGQSINGEEITPNLNQLMQESMYFSNYYHQTGQGRTSDADFTSHSSLHPLPSGSVFVRYPNQEYDVLPKILKGQGYRTSVFHAYTSSFWNRTNMYKAMQYDKYYSKNDFTIDEPLGWSLGDKSFFKQSLNYMQQDTGPFYSFLITLTSHHPYSLPEKEQKLNVGDFKGSIFGNYLQAIHYEDAAFGELIKGMKEDGLWDNTILYIYGDHDNSIKDKNYYEQFLGKSLSDLDMHQIMNQVPLFIHLPDGKHAGEYDQATGMLDMSPSLLHLLGVSTDSFYQMGRNIFDVGTDNRLIVLRSGAFTDGEVYYIPSPDGVFENSSCYDLSTRQTTNVELCRPGQQEANKRLNISDKVITYNLISKFNKDGNP